MRMSNGMVGIAISVESLLSGHASAFRWTPLPYRDSARISNFSSLAAPKFLVLLSNLNARAGNSAAGASIDAGLPCPSGHNWDVADKTRKPAPQKAAKLKTPSFRADAPEKVNAKKAANSPRIVKTASASATKIPNPGQPKSRTKAPVSCIAACSANCGGAGGKKGKSACGPVYDACVAAC
jgi:hypothetical protein